MHRRCSETKRGPEPEVWSQQPAWPSGPLESSTTCSQLGLQVHWSRARLAVSHDRTLEDVERVGALVQEQPVRMPLDSDAEEVVKRPQILHRKFPLESGNGPTQKLRAGSC
jgi:hypothetical protein